MEISGLSSSLSSRLGEQHRPVTTSLGPPPPQDFGKTELGHTLMRGWLREATHPKEAAERLEWAKQGGYVPTPPPTPSAALIRQIKRKAAPQGDGEEADISEEESEEYRERQAILEQTAADVLMELTESEVGDASPALATAGTEPRPLSPHPVEEGLLYRAVPGAATREAVTVSRGEPPAGPTTPSLSGGLPTPVISERAITISITSAFRRVASRSPARGTHVSCQLLCSSS